VNISVAPTSMMIRELGNPAAEGRVPGMRSERDVFSDSAHMGDLGGFAIAVGSIEDPQARGYWHGNASIEEDTSGFGSIVIESSE